MHYWNALSIHLLTKDNKTFQASRETRADEIIETLGQQLTPVGASGMASFHELRRIVLHAADIGLQVAKLPFTLSLLEALPGWPFQQKFFEDVDIGDDIGPDGLELDSVPISLVLFPPVVKLEFDSEGNLMILEPRNVAQATVISKGRVVCHLQSFPCH